MDCQILYIMSTTLEQLLIYYFLVFNCIIFFKYILFLGHTGSVLCLQYDEKVIISGSSDSTVRVWDVESGEMVNTLIHHCEAVLHLRYVDCRIYIYVCNNENIIFVIFLKEINYFLRAIIYVYSPASQASIYFIFYHRFLYSNWLKS